MRQHSGIAPRLLSMLVLSLGLHACVSSHLLVGNPRAPIPAGEVRVFVQTPAAPYEEIAILETSSARSLAWNQQGKIDAVIRRLKREAARLGANAIVVHVLADGAPTSIGAGIGTGLVGSHGTLGIGFESEGSTTAEKIGRATAIYLPAMPPDTMPP